MPFPRTATPHFVRACEVERHVKISQEPLYTEIYRRNAGAKNRDPHFVWACAVETHVKIAQEPLRTEIYKKNAGARIRDPYFVRACAVETHVKISQATSDGNLQVKCCRPKPRRTLCASLRRRNACHKSHFARRFTGKKLGPATHTFCEPAKSKHMSRFHKSHSIRKFAGKMPQTRVSTLIKHRPLLLL